MMRSLFEAPAISVGELCRKIRHALRGEFPSAVRVLGEISNYRKVDGHMYFSLKDRDGRIDCICFQSTAKSLRLKFEPSDGAEVEVDGYIDIYERKSSYQLQVSNIVPVGQGALYVAIERLKTRLDSEGLFAAARKRPIPSFIRYVAIVTSKNAAVLADFVTTCRRRGAHVRIKVVDAPVQGAAAAPALARAIVRAGRLPVDVVVVARGGGSVEDLFAFNTEQVAHAIAACERPVISAVGHETDWTIADLVADKRAATATAAAEFVAQEREALLDRVNGCERRLRLALVRAAAVPRSALRSAVSNFRRVVTSLVAERFQRVDELRVALTRSDPRKQILRWRERTVHAALRLPVLSRRIIAASRASTMAAERHLAAQMAQFVKLRTNELNIIAAKLAALGPRETLDRGYAIVYGASGSVLTSSKHAKIGETIGVELKSGWLGATVREKKDHGREDR